MAAHTIFGSSDTVRILPQSTWQAFANEHAVHCRRFSRAIIRPLQLLIWLRPPACATDAHDARLGMSWSLR